MGKRREEPGAPEPERAPGAPEAPSAAERTPAPGEAEPEVLEELRKLVKPAYEDEYRERLRLMRENESMSRECILIEDEIRQHQDKHGTLTETITNLRQNRDGLQKKVDALNSQRSSLASLIEKLSASKRSLEDELARLRKQNRAYFSAIEKFQEERRNLIA